MKKEIFNNPTLANRSERILSQSILEVNKQLYRKNSSQQISNETHRFNRTMRTNLGIILYERFYTNKLLYSELTLSKSRVKRAGDDETLEEATAKKDYTYWLNQEDIADIARLEYMAFKGFNGDAEFEVLGAISQLSLCIEAFQVRAKACITNRLTLIINLANLHWVTLVISYKNKSFLGYYVDSKNNPLPAEYYQLLGRFSIQILSLSPDFPQQTDEYNCGLWALENARDLCWMLDENQSIYWLINKLKSPRDKSYFDRTRRLFAKALRADPVRGERLLKQLQDPMLQKSPKILESDESDIKKSVFQLKEEKKIKINLLLETYVTEFFNDFINKLTVYHVVAKGEKLTTEALKTELKTGVTGALLGIILSQNIVGSIPSLVASLRLLSAKYYVSKAKAQKITKAISETLPGSLSLSLYEAATNIFICFESQFMQVTDKAGDKMAIEKLADDAVGRIFNYIAAHPADRNFISKEVLEKAVLLGPSEKFFDPIIKQARVRICGNLIQDKSGNTINTANLYEKIGIKSVSNSHPKFYKRTVRTNSNTYGYRRLFDWEKEENDELKTSLKEHYAEEHFPQKETTFQFSSRNYDYQLKTEMVRSLAQIIFDKTKNHYPPEKKVVEHTLTQPLLFNLRKPIKNFTGRTEILKELHRRLLTGSITSIVPALSSLSFYPTSEIHPSSSDSQFSVSGLGGIGKTQLALRYAELFASAYDHNVLWIDAETKENIAYSFYKLATKLHLETKDQYGQTKNTEEIIEEIYAYFADRKSLFIFDNAENYNGIRNYLPKSILGNTPTLLITSRHNNWINIANTLSLDVFSKEETKEFIKKIIDIPDNTQDEAIKELNTLLQGLPLALQQALAYITLQKNTQAEFNIQDYIVQFKKKSEELLNFDFSSYTNDPYRKTVLTTWQISLDKILSDSTHGKNAIEILNIMAYLNPDAISGTMFLYLKYIYAGDYNVEAALHLLKSYSMVSTGNQPDIFIIHRLVQQVVRIHLEKDSIQFQNIIKVTHQLLLNKSISNKSEMNFHYLHFLLYMSEHPELRPILQFGEVSKVLFEKLLYLDLKYWFYFLDLAYIKFTKKRHFDFLSEALAYFLKEISYLFFSETLNYIEKKWQEKIFSKEDVKYILENAYGAKKPVFKIFRFSRIPEKKEVQRNLMELIYSLKIKIFGDALTLYDSCPEHHFKRAINPCLLPETDEQIKELKEQAFKYHFKKVAQLSRWLSTGLLTKDTLSALLQGDFKSVAINSILITSSALSKKVSNSLLLQGKNLAADASLLEKDLGLENKQALHILFNEEVLSVGKRRFLGKTLQVASPFVARLPSIYFATLLKKEYEIYKNGDETILPDIISNGIIVGIDGLEAGIEGAEIFELISGIAEFTGPVAEVVVAFTWLSEEIYYAKQQVAEIEKYVHLSKTEEFIQFLRTFFQLAPSEYLQIKANNNKLIQHAINFLKAHTVIKQYIFPAFHSTTTLSDNNEVLLDMKRELTIDEDTVPDHPSEGHLFCLSGTLKNSTTINHTFTYLCKNAIGIEVTANRTGDTTLINLGEGNDKAIAFLNSPTLFLVQNGRKSYKGGDKENVFVLQGNSITGILKGGKGSNVLIANNFNPKNSDYLLRDSNGFLCGTNRNATLGKQVYCSSGNSLKLGNVNQIHGRKNQQDIIFINRGIRFIDGYGGESNEQLDCFFVTTPSYKNPMIVLRNNARIVVYPNIGIHAVEYSIPTDEVGETQVQFDFKEAVQHQFFFEAPLQNLAAMTIENNTIHISLTDFTYKNTDRKIFSLHILDPYSATSNITDFSTNIAYFFENIEFKLLKKGQVYIRELFANNSTIDEKINLFRKLAVRLDKTFSIQLINNITISIGQGKHEIFYTNGQFESHLIGNGGENVYIFLPENATEFPLRKATLYDTTEDLDSAELINTLDLRAIVEKIKQIYPGCVIVLSVSSSEKDLILTLAADYPFNIFLITIKLKNALLTNWYQKLDIFWEDFIPRNIAAMDDDIWTVVEAPLIFTDDKQIIILTKEDIGEEAEIILLRNMGDYLFFRHGTNLILNNCIGNSNDCCAIIAQKFYQIPEMKRKILSATFKFFDQDIQLQDHQKEIEHAADFSAYLAFVTANTTEIPSFLNSTESISHSSDQETSMPPLDRPKRQPDLEKTVSKLPEWLAIKTQSRLTTKTVHVPNSKTIRHTLDPEDSDKNLLKRHRDGFKPIMNEIKESMTSSTTRIGNWLNLLAEMSIGRFKKAVQSFFLGNKEFNPPAFPLDSKQANTHALPFCIPGAQQGQSFVNGITCYTTNRKVMIFLKDSNVKLKKPEDIYFKQSCRPVEFNERPSVYCEGEKTNMVYTPEIPQRPFEQINEQLTLLQVVLHEGKKLYGWLQHFFSGKNSEVNSPQRTSITREQKEIWKKLLTDIEVGFTDLENTCEEEVKLRWAWYILEDRKAEFDYLSRQSELDLEKINAFIENLQALQAELKVMMDRAPTTHEPDKSDLIRKMKESPSSISNYYHLDNTPVLSKKSVNIQNTELALQGNQNFFKTVRPSVPYSGLITVEKKYTPASA